MNIYLDIFKYTYVKEKKKKKTGSAMHFNDTKKQNKTDKTQFLVFSVKIYLSCCAGYLETVSDAS